MAFGSPITDGTLVASGANGGIYLFDLTAQNIGTFISCKLQNTNTGALSEMLTHVDATALFGYSLESADTTVEAAVSFAGNRAFVFIQATAFPSADTRVAFFFKGKPEYVDAVSDNIDIPAESRQLLTLLCKQLALVADDGTPDRFINQEIAKETARLGLQ